MVSGCSRLRSILAWYGGGGPCVKSQLSELTVCLNDASKGGITADLTINSFTHCCYLLKMMDGVNSINVRPTFSFGDIDGLIKLRRKNAQPFALWYSIVKSLEIPDGMWAGNQALVHDYAYAHTLNRIGYKNREFLLDFSEFIVEPLLKHTSQASKESNTKQQTEFRDYYFFNNLNELIGRLPAKAKENFNENVYCVNDLLYGNKLWHEKLLYAREKLIDQASYLNVNTHYGKIIYQMVMLSESDNDAEAFFIINWILYHAFKENNSDNIFKLLKNVLSDDSDFSYVNFGVEKHNNIIYSNSLDLCYEFWKNIYTK